MPANCLNNTGRFAPVVGCRCSACQRYRKRKREWARSHRASSPEYKKYKSAYDKRYAKANPEKRKANSWKYWLRVTYGISPEEYAQRAVDQGGRCQICDVPFAGGGYRAELDHCHACTDPHVRAFVCKHCNKLLSGAHDRVSTLANAITYLVKHGCQPANDNEQSYLKQVKRGRQDDK